jgi:hypothetical protein
MNEPKRDAPESSSRRVRDERRRALDGDWSPLRASDSSMSGRFLVVLFWVFSFGVLAVVGWGALLLGALGAFLGLFLLGRARLVRQSGERRPLLVVADGLVGFLSGVVLTGAAVAVSLTLWNFTRLREVPVARIPLTLGISVAIAVALRAFDRTSDAPSLRIRFWLGYLVGFALVLGRWF